MTRVSASLLRECFTAKGLRLREEVIPRLEQWVWFEVNHWEQVVLKRGEHDLPKSEAVRLLRRIHMTWDDFVARTGVHV